MVQRAVHYSRAAAALLASGHIAADTFKCPAWPDLLPTVLAAHPAYVHFALKAGAGIGDAVDTETGQPADWGRVEALLERTGTPFVNVHLSPIGADLPGMPTDTTAAHDVEHVTACLIRDVQAVVARFGAARVIVENDHDNGSLHLRPAYLPGVISRVVAETGCGFLLDLAHVRLAAHILGIDPHAYCAALPVAAIREVHVSGVQPFGERFVAMLARGGVRAHGHATLRRASDGPPAHDRGGLGVHRVGAGPHPRRTLGETVGRRARIRWCRPVVGSRHRSGCAGGSVATLARARRSGAHEQLTGCVPALQGMSEDCGIPGYP